MPVNRAERGVDGLRLGRKPVLYADDAVCLGKVWAEERVQPFLGRLEPAVEIYAAYEGLRQGSADVLLPPQ